MKKLISLILSAALIIALSSGIALAMAGGNSNGGGKGNSKSGVKTSSSVAQGQVRNQAAKGQASTVKSKFQQKLAVCNQQSAQNLRIQNRFKDVRSHWASKTIEKMSAIGLLNGYEDGTFRPDVPITQAESVALIMLATSEEDTTTTTDNPDNSSSNTNTPDDSTDVSDSDTTDDTTEDVTGDTSDENNTEDDQLIDTPTWARGAALKAATNGIINLNRFYSQVQTNRAQVAVMLAKALGLEPVDISNLPFSDGILISNEDAGYIMALYQEGIIKGTPEGKFNPNNAITRAEMAALLEQVIDDPADDGNPPADDTTTTDDTTTDDSNPTSEGTTDQSSTS